MGFRTTVADFLGRVLSPGVTGPAVDSGAADPEGLQSFRWMEVARRVMCGYVTAAIQRCPVVVYRDGMRAEGTDTGWLWNVSPNPNQSRPEFVAELLDDLLVSRGEALVVPVRSGGVHRLYVADGWCAKPVPGAATVYSGISIEGSTEVVPYPMSADEVYHFDIRGVGGGWSQLMEASSSRYDRLADALGTAVEDRNARRWIMHSEAPLTGNDQQAKAVRDQVQSQLMPFVKHNTGVMPLFKGQSLERASNDSGRLSGTGAKDVASVRADMFALVASTFRIPAGMLEGKTAGFDADLTSFLTFAVDPVARLLSDEITRKQCSRLRWRRGDRVEVDTHHVRHADLFEVADKVEKLVGSSINSPNEIRGFTGQDPIDEPWADEYQRTKNHEDAGGGETK